MNAQQLADWLYANKDNQESPEFQAMLEKFRQAQAQKESPKEPARTSDRVQILQEEYRREYERPPSDAKDAQQKRINLEALSTELAALKAAPPEQATRSEPAAEAPDKFASELEQIEQASQAKAPESNRMNAQIIGGVGGAGVGAVQQGQMIKDAAKELIDRRAAANAKAQMDVALYKEGLAAERAAEREAAKAAERAVANRNVVSDVEVMPAAGEVKPAQIAATANRFYEANPSEMERGRAAAGGPGTYAYARALGLQPGQAEQAKDYRHAQELIKGRATGLAAAEKVVPFDNLIERPSGVLTLEDKAPPRSRTVFAPEAPPEPPAPKPSFAPGKAALFQPLPGQKPPAPAPVPAAAPSALPAPQGPAFPGLPEQPLSRPSSAARPAVQSALDSVKGMFERNVSQPTARLLSAAPILPKTLGGVQIGGGLSEAATGAKNRDASQVMSGGLETLGGGLSMVRKTAPAGLAVSILAQLYRNARTPEDRQKIADTINELMFGEKPKTM
jgi:hypothetical protein